MSSLENKILSWISFTKNYISYPFSYSPKHLRCECQIWGQNQSKIVEAIKRTLSKAFQKLNFWDPRQFVDYLYKQSKIDKLKNFIIKTSCWLVYDQLKNNLPETFSNFFTLNTQSHKDNTRKNRLILTKVETISYGSNFITLKAVRQWNEIQNFIKMTYSKFLKSVENYFGSEQ